MHSKIMVVVALAMSCAPPDGMDGGDLGRVNGEDASVSDDLRPPGAGMPGSSQKLHLIVAASGEDLGILVDLATYTVFVEKANALITVNIGMPEAANYFYADRDCMGAPMIYRLGGDDAPALQNRYYWLSPQGTYVRETTPLPRSSYQSTMVAKSAAYDGMTTCMNAGPGIRDDFWQFADSGVRFAKPSYKPDELKVELR